MYSRGCSGSRLQRGREGAVQAGAPDLVAPTRSRPQIAVSVVARRHDRRLAGAGSTRLSARSQRASDPAGVCLCPQWRPHDLVMWDNRQTMHRVRRFDETQPRDMRRNRRRHSRPSLSRPRSNFFTSPALRGQRSDCEAIRVRVNGCGLTVEGLASSRAGSDEILSIRRVRRHRARPRPEAFAEFIHRAALRADPFGPRLRPLPAEERER